VLSVFRTWLRGNRLDRDLDDELRGCLDELVARKVRSGLPPARARREAIVELGGLESIKEEVRSGRFGHEAITTVRDIRFAWRLLARSPGFSLVATLTLALGIGANVAVFSVMHAVFWRSLPYPDADRLVLVRVDARGVANAGAAPGEVLDLRARSGVLESLAAVNGVDAHVFADGEYQRVAAASVTDGVLEMLGAAPPALGRTLRATEDVGQPWVRSIVISDDLWRRKFGGDPAALGRRVQVNNLDVQIVGILRPGFRVFLPPETLAAEQIDVWFPANLENTRDHRGLPLVGRLEEGATVGQAQAELDTLAAQFVADFPGAYPGRTLRFSVLPLRKALTAEVQQALFALAGAVAFVLLIACVNVANLTVARGRARDRELTVRRALGATRARLVRQLLTESLLLACAGAAGGLLLGYLGVGLLDWMRPSHLPRQSEVAIDSTVVLLTVAAAALTPLAVGLLPSMRIVSGRGALSLTSSRSETALPAVRRLQRALVIAEVALAIVPLVAAGLMLRTFVNLIQAPIGFNPSHVLTARVPISFRNSHDIPARVTLLQEVLHRVREQPGVDDVSAGAPLPFDSSQLTRRYGRDDDPSAPMSLGTLQSVMPGYLRVMGIELREGREFDTQDQAARRPVVIVDERIARQLWPEGALGKRLAIQVGRDGRSALEVIGVTNAVRVTRVRDEGLPHFFMPYHIYSINMSLVIKTSESAAALGPAIQRIAESVGTRRAVFDIQPMDDYVAQSVGDARFTLLVLLAFALASILLAGVGLYGTLSYLISQRTREFGVRMALGASSRQLVRTVVCEGAALAVVGAAVGLAGALTATTLLRGLLYEVTPFDVPTLLLVCFLVTLVAVVAAARPAWRVTRIDPTLALRAE
jgi:putative ABC transport system permease protein